MSATAFRPFQAETVPEFLRRHTAGRHAVRTEVVAWRFGWTVGKAYRELQALTAAGLVAKHAVHPTDSGWSCSWLATEPELDATPPAALPHLA